MPCDVIRFATVISDRTRRNHAFANTTRPNRCVMRSHTAKETASMRITYRGPVRTAKLLGVVTSQVHTIRHTIHCIHCPTRLYHRLLLPWWTSRQSVRGLQQSLKAWLLAEHSTCAHVCDVVIPADDVHIAAALNCCCCPRCCGLLRIVIATACCYLRCCSLGV